MKNSSPKKFGKPTQPWSASLSAALIGAVLQTLSLAPANASAVKDQAVPAAAKAKAAAPKATPPSKPSANGVSTQQTGVLREAREQGGRAQLRIDERWFSVDATRSRISQNGQPLNWQSLAIGSKLDITYFLTNDVKEGHLPVLAWVYAQP